MKTEFCGKLVLSTLAQKQIDDICDGQFETKLSLGVHTSLKLARE